MDTTVTETLRPSLTVSDPDVQLTVLSGAAGPTGPAGPNDINSSTTVTGTVDLSIHRLTANTVPGTTTVSGSAGDFTTLAVGTNSNEFIVSSGGNLDVFGVATFGDSISVFSNIGAGGDITAPDILASEDLGYSSGGAETQDPTLPITTGVTLNAPSGVITLLSSHTYLSPFVGSTPANPSINFTLTNTAIGANDVVVVSLQDGDDSLSVSVTNTTTGACDISIRNGGTSNVTLASAVKVNFAVIKVATS